MQPEAESVAYGKVTVVMRGNTSYAECKWRQVFVDIVPRKVYIPIDSSAAVRKISRGRLPPGPRGLETLQYATRDLLLEKYKEYLDMRTELKRGYQLPGTEHKEFRVTGSLHDSKGNTLWQEMLEGSGKFQMSKLTELEQSHAASRARSASSRTGTTRKTPRLENQAGRLCVCSLRNLDGR